MKQSYRGGEGGNRRGGRGQEGTRGEGGDRRGGREGGRGGDRRGQGGREGEMVHM